MRHEQLCDEHAAMIKPSQSNWWLQDRTGKVICHICGKTATWLKIDTRAPSDDDK